jgi:hypothetical protein
MFTLYGKIPMLGTTLVRCCLYALLGTLAACGGSGSNSATEASSSSSNASSALTAGSLAGGSSSGSASSSSSSSSGSSSSSSSGSGSSSSGSSATNESSGPAAKLAAKLGMPSRLLVGLGTQGDYDTLPAILSQNLKIDIYERYLNGVGSGDWTTWDSPAGQYVLDQTLNAASVGAMPMYVLYQMSPSDVSPNGGTLASSNLQSTSFMNGYWNNVRLMYQMIARSGKPTLVNLEPDFFAFAQQQALAVGQDGGTTFAYVNNNPDCSSQPNNIIGIAGCLVQMARKYASNAYIGFPPADWGANGNVPAVVAFSNELNAGSADFIVLQTLDGDAGCYEAQLYQCVRSGSGWYWDESNTTTPNFNQYFAKVNQYQQGIGNGQLPVLIWQNPEGVPSSSPGGYQHHFRDNREHYFLTHPSQLVASHVFGITFSSGTNLTAVTTDGGQFQSLDNAYLATPVALQ